MHFELSDDQQTFQSSARQYFESKGKLSISRDYIEGNENILEDHWNELGELGYLGINVPETYGGLDMGTLTLVPVLEEMGRIVMPGPFPETWHLPFRLSTSMEQLSRNSNIYRK